MQGEVNEECGVFGIFAPAPSNVAKYVYYGLYALQHRGQESWGIVVNDDGIFKSHKDLGLVNEVFNKDVMARLPQGKIAVGHVRYGTTGATNRNNCQPIEVNHRKGRIAIAHNGNLSNAYNLREQLEMTGAIFHTTCDTEIIAYYERKTYRAFYREGFERGFQQNRRSVFARTYDPHKTYRGERPSGLPSSLLRHNALQRVHSRV